MKRLENVQLAEQIREILVKEQDHQIDLATALGEEVPNVNARFPTRRFAQATLTLLASVGTVVVGDCGKQALIVLNF